MAFLKIYDIPLRAYEVLINCLCTNFMYYGIFVLLMYYLCTYYGICTTYVLFYVLCTMYQFYIPCNVLRTYVRVYVEVYICNTFHLSSVSCK